MTTIPLPVPSTFNSEGGWVNVAFAFRPAHASKSQFSFLAGLDGAVGSLGSFCDQVMIATFAFTQAVFEAFHHKLVRKGKKRKKKKIMFSFQGRRER